MIKLIYPIYFGIIIAIIAKAFANFLFSKKRIKERLLDFAKSLIAAPFFPFFLLSKKGWKILLTLINK